MGKKNINLVRAPPRVKVDSVQSAASRGKLRKASSDEVITATGSAIDIPRTSLGKGGYFGETITTTALTFAVRREPVAKRIVLDVAEDVWDKGFSVRPITKSGEEKPDTKLDDQVQTLLKTLDFQNLAVRASQYDRRYGWAIMLLGYKDNGATLETPLDKPTELDHIAVYSPRSVTVTKEDDDVNSARYGLPVMYEVSRSKTPTKVHYTRVIHVATNLDEHPYQGVPVLEAVWDDMTVYRNLRYALGQVYWRMGGMFVFTVPAKYTSADVQKFHTAMGDPNVRTFLTVPDDKKVDVLGSQGRVLTPKEFIDAVLRSIAIGSGIPKAKLEGVEAGAVTGSEVNQREYYKVISDLQKRYESAIVRPLLQILADLNKIHTSDFHIDWVSGFELDPGTAADVRLKNAQAADLELSHQTVDEVRARSNIKPLAQVTKQKQLGDYCPGLTQPDPSLKDRLLRRGKQGT